ncbi:hypothetical protein ccrud_02990 [Corynebacterium crudilactis]|uniref:Uncharacterized protein n=1 Tax=Corynebacterium crudilactis TaxID=1652495 RepID=A0A172QRH0_9CORY|nr:hypothetical protein ccrud_02990 [Corynebacterium crudilactis]
MVAVEYAEFLQKFRERTAQRMEEFEKSLASTQQKISSAAMAVEVEEADKKKRVTVSDVSDKPVSMIRRSTRSRGPVKSVLRDA